MNITIRTPVKTCITTNGFALFRRDVGHRDAENQIDDPEKAQSHRAHTHSSRHKTLSTFVHLISGADTPAFRHGEEAPSPFFLLPHTLPDTV